jgi:hypothetical protein
MNTADADWVPIIDYPNVSNAAHPAAGDNGVVPLSGNPQCESMLHGM